MSDHEFMTFVTVLIVGMAIFIAAAKEFVDRAGPLAFAIVMLLSDLHTWRLGHAGWRV